MQSFATHFLRLHGVYGTVRMVRRIVDDDVADKLGTRAIEAQKDFVLGVVEQGHLVAPTRHAVV